MRRSIAVDYPLENLSPDTFQELVQALLVPEFPDIQCFPVGQGDGGRDAIQWVWRRDARKHSFLLFQVKFARNPAEVKDPIAWLRAAVEEEMSKVNLQALRGAQRYIVITNVRGTATQDSGRIDQVQQSLTEGLSIPARCWWREDIARRLDSAWAVKWAYPQILTGPDILRAILESGLSEQAARRTDAIRAAVAGQYDRERDVRFKQVELQSRLIDLFVDSPLLFPESSSDRSAPSKAQALYTYLTHRYAAGQDVSEVSRSTRDAREERAGVGAGTFLLSDDVQNGMPFLVLEGAPGQGKSTLTQYVCQVHRMRLLGKTSELAEIAGHHQRCPVRVPLRVDLRDFATWLGRRDPFSADPTAPAPEPWTKSLDAFLAALVRNASGGTSFDVSDLVAVAKVTAFLLVFDGLDEVADIKTRAEVVDELNRGLGRLVEMAASLQVIITSRPSAFANSPGMPRNRYPHFRLGPLTASLIEQYAGKWSTARRLDERERAEIKRILKDKLALPHLRDLARNPMQLTILLSLIHARGTSLPDKRTALYDAYVDLFFSRESEKSQTVREHRELLVDIHRYLAWILHSEAELGNASGRVPFERMQQLIRHYLVANGHDSDIAEHLFFGVVERVVALVSRVQGTYEFEVQPLREYFAARYLYDTAPYSPTGSEKAGTKPDRFMALAQNPYWLNVTRFYAGCYSKGELSSLIDGLRELRDQPAYSQLGHPRTLAAMLLSDWVFSQHPRSIRDVVALMCDEYGLRYLLAAPDFDAPSSPLLLADDRARQEVVTHCWSILERTRARDFALSVCRLIRGNAKKGQTFEGWLRQVETRPDRARWLEYGLFLGHLADCSETVLENTTDPTDVDHVRLLARARRHRFLERSEKSRAVALRLVLAGEASGGRLRAEASMLWSLSLALDVHRYVNVFYSRDPRPLRVSWEHRNNVVPDEPPVLDDAELASNIRDVLEVVRTQAEKPASEWASSLTPWDRIAEVARSKFGDVWLIRRFAAVAAGIRSADERAADCDDLLDSSISLVRRARYARLRSGGEAWWKRTLGTPSVGVDDARFALLLCLSWASERAIIALAADLSRRLDDLSSGDWDGLYAACTDVIQVARSATENCASSLPRGTSVRLAAVLMLRANNEGAHALYRRFVRGSAARDVTVLQACAGVACRNLLTGGQWAGDLEFIRASYHVGADFDRATSHWVRRDARSRPLSRELASSVCGAPGEFPPELVAVAEQRLLLDTMSSVAPVGKVAQRDRWFSE